MNVYMVRIRLLWFHPCTQTVGIQQEWLQIHNGYFGKWTDFTFQIIMAAIILSYYEWLQVKWNNLEVFCFVSLNVVMNIDEHIHNLISIGLIGKWYWIDNCISHCSNMSSANRHVLQSKSLSKPCTCVLNWRVY